MIDTTWNGWLSGLGEAKNSVYETTDKGKTWDFQGSVPFVPDRIAFVDDLNGFAISGFHPHIVGKTGDGGKSWTIQELDISPQRVKAAFALDAFFPLPSEIIIVDRQTIWLVLYGRILISRDTGLTWHYHKELDGVFSATKGSAKTGLALVRNRVYGTNDGGDTWQFFTDMSSETLGRFSKTGRNGIFRIVRLIDEKNGWLFETAPADHAVYHTSDGGKSWENYEIRGSRDRQSDALTWLDGEARNGYCWAVGGLGRTDASIFFLNTNGVFMLSALDPGTKLFFPISGPAMDNLWIATGTNGIGTYRTGEVHLEP